MDRAVFDSLQEARAAKRPVALVTDLETGAQRLLDPGREQGPLALSEASRAEAERRRRSDASGRLESEPRLFVQVFAPPLRLLIVGAVHISQALAPMAALAGYEVKVIDPRRAWATTERFPGVALIDAWPDDALDELEPDRRTAVVTLTHDPKIDDPALHRALASEAFYIGALGSRRTHAKRVERLSEAGISGDAIARINAPIGLAIGAKTPAEIAIAILAQITETLRKRPAPDAETRERAA